MKKREIGIIAVLTAILVLTVVYREIFADPIDDAGFWVGTQVETADYRIFYSSTYSMFYAKNGETGAIDWSNSNASYVIQQCVNTVGPKGGRISFGSHNFTLDTPITIPETTNALYFDGQGAGKHALRGTVFRATDPTMTSMITCDYTNDQLGVRALEIRSIQFDANNYADRCLDLVNTDIATIEDCQLSDFTEYGLISRFEGVSGYPTSGSAVPGKIYVRGCEIGSSSSSTACIRFDYNTQNEVSSCIFNPNDAEAIIWLKTSYKTRIFGNEFNQLTGGGTHRANIYIHSTGEGTIVNSRDLTIFGNWHQIPATHYGIQINCTSGAYPTRIRINENCVWNHANFFNGTIMRESSISVAGFFNRFLGYVPDSYGRVSIDFHCYFNQKPFVQVNLQQSDRQWYISSWDHDGTDYTGCNITLTDLAGGAVSGGSSINVFVGHANN